MGSLPRDDPIVDGLDHVWGSLAEEIDITRRRGRDRARRKAENGRRSRTTSQGESEKKVAQGEAVDPKRCRPEDEIWRDRRVCVCR
jgi:hypothetical protein